LSETAGWDCDSVGAFLSAFFSPNFGIDESVDMVTEQAVREIRTKRVRKKMRGFFIEL
jgi:hypothetical protein